MRLFPIFLAAVAAHSIDASAAAPAAPDSQQPNFKYLSDAADGLFQLDGRSGCQPSRPCSWQVQSNVFDDRILMFVVPVPGFGVGREEAAERFVKAFGSTAAPFRRTPIRVGISADGQHGFTFGFAETTRENEPPLLQKYVAYWINRSTGWRIALLKILPRSEGEVSITALQPSVPDPSTWEHVPRKDPQGSRKALETREREFSNAAQTIGLGPAFARYGSADAVNSGGEREFVLGNAAVGDLHGTGPSPLNWSADGGVIVSSSGDLGVTWGALRRNGPTPPGRMEKIPFFTVWRRASPNSPWLYVAE